MSTIEVSILDTGAISLSILPEEEEGNKSTKFEVGSIRSSSSPPPSLDTDNFFIRKQEQEKYQEKSKRNNNDDDDDDVIRLYPPKYKMKTSSSTFIGKRNNNDDDDVIRSSPPKYKMKTSSSPTSDSKTISLPYLEANSKVYSPYRTREKAELLKPFHPSPLSITTYRPIILPIKQQKEELHDYEDLLIPNIDQQDDGISFTFDKKSFLSQLKKQEIEEENIRKKENHEDDSKKNEEQINKSFLSHLRKGDDYLSPIKSKRSLYDDEVEYNVDFNHSKRRSNKQRFGSKLANEVYESLLMDSPSSLNKNRVNSKTTSTRDTLATDLDRFKYEPKYKNLKENSLISSFRDIKGEDSNIINKTKRREVLVQFETQTDVDVIHDDDDISNIVKHVMERPFGTLKILKEHFLERNQQVNDESIKGSSNKRKSSNKIKLYNNNNNENHNLKMVTRGGIFLKTTSDGSTHRRFVWVSNDYKNIFWSSPEPELNSGETRSLSLVGAKVLIGQQTIPFQRRNDSSAMNRCFSIVSNTRSLDLEVIRAPNNSDPKDEEQQRNEWVDAFRQAINISKS